MQRLKNELYEQFKQFSTTETYKALKKIAMLRKLKLSVSKLLSESRSSPPLYGDPIFQKIFVMAGREVNASAIVETGTYQGSTTRFLSENFQEIMIYSCEINKDNYKASKANLKDKKNIRLFHDASPNFLEMLNKKKMIGNIPVFFLDAHWLDDWPLEKEIKIISKLDKALIIIHDFKIPNDDRFKYDKYGKKECSVEMIAPFMDKKNSYKMLLPNYGKENLKDSGYYYELVGYPLIFQNLDKEFKSFNQREIVKKFFVDKSDLLKKAIK